MSSVAETMSGEIKGTEHWTNKGDARLFLWNKCIGDPAKTIGTVLFVHGSSMASQPTFDLQVPGRPDSSAMEWFARRGYDIWSVDMEGYGRSTKDRDNNADDRLRRRRLLCRRDLHREAARQARPLLVYGISSGALRAALFAQRHPEMVARLALDAHVWTGAGSPTLAERRKKLPEFSAQEPATDRPRLRAFDLHARPSRHRRRRGGRGLCRSSARARRFGADRHLCRHVLQPAGVRSGEDHRADHRSCAANGTGLRASTT